MDPHRVSARRRGRHATAQVTDGAQVTESAREVPELFELEAVIMNLMWRVEKATVREMRDAINESGDRQRAYTTILTTVRRLYAKGFLERERIDRTDTYRAALSREDYMQARARKQVEDLVKEYGDVALANFARQVDSLDSDRLAALRALAGRPGGTDSTRE